MQVAPVTQPQYVNLVTGEDVPQAIGITPRFVTWIINTNISSLTCFFPFCRSVPVSQPFQPMPIPQQQQQKMSRELKVEDALLYLDQVKMEYR